MTQTAPAGSVRLYDATPGHLERWNDFLARVPDGSFYQRFEWKRVNESEFRHEALYLAVERDGQVAAVLPLVLVSSRLFGRILCSMPFLNFGGPASLDADSETALIEAGCNIAVKNNVDYLEIRSARPLAYDLQSSKHKVALTVGLSNDPDEVWNAFKSKHRTNIRRVYKDGVSVVRGHADLLDSFYEIMCNSWRSLGTPIYAKRFFRTILETFGEDVCIFIAYLGRKPIATAFNGHFNGAVEGMWAGSLPEGRSLQVNYVLYWEMIKDACERGFSRYHLGRSTVDTGGESFKKKWNAEATQLYWSYFMPGGGEMPNLNVDNPKFDLAIRAWRKLPLWATKSIGPLLSRSIP